MFSLRTMFARSSVALLVALAACSSGQEVTLGPTSTDPTTVATTDVTAPAVTDVVTVATNIVTIKSKRRVERPSGTPRGTVIPAGDDAYLLLSTGRCSELLQRTGTWRQDRNNQVNEDAFVLYKAAAEACLGRWDDARRDFQRLENLHPSFTGGCNSNNCERCMRAVRDWLIQVLAVRREEPTTDIELVKGTQRSPCPAPDGQTTTTEESTTTTRRSTSTLRAATSTSR